MKIAFVGKGGAGKSTTAALFASYITQLKQPLLIIDADINVHLGSLLGINDSNVPSISKEKLLTYLKGSNTSIDSWQSIVKTTPPGRGSNLISLSSANPIIEQMAIFIAGQTYLMIIGSYDQDSIGTSCYHNNLALCENIISHTYLAANQWLIVDMVAGTDAFSNSLHAQFDHILFVAEPTEESILVWQQYIQLAKAANIDSGLHVIVNKVESSDDLEFIYQHIDKQKIIGIIPYDSSLKLFRRNHHSIEQHPLSSLPLWPTVANLKKKLTDDEKLLRLHELHKKYCQLTHVINKHGDIEKQIDSSFEFSSLYEK